MHISLITSSCLAHQQISEVVVIQPILIVVGTRPEAIKLLPVYFACKRARLPVVLCTTSQHEELAQVVFKLFDVQCDYDLHVMKPKQDLFYVTQAVLGKIKEVLLAVKPSMVLVQGDTTTSMAASLAAFYAQIPIGHVEAGLRTHDMNSPFPEEMNRRFISLVAEYHFAPTAAATANILTQGVHRDNVFCVGNTVVDALQYILTKINAGSMVVASSINDIISFAQKQSYSIVLLTMHRRESFNGGIDRVLSTIKETLDKHPQMFIIFPYHPNPAVKEAIARTQFSEHERVHVCQALAYHDLVYVLSASDWVMTDSGGLQEEATSLGKPTLVLRNNTERMESVWAGMSYIVGTDREKIISGVALMNKGIVVVAQYQNLYGDGHAAEKIALILMQKLAQPSGYASSIVPEISLNQVL